MKKSIIWLVIVGIMLLAACSSADDTEKKEEPNQDVAQEDDDKQETEDNKKENEQEESPSTDEEKEEPEKNQTDEGAVEEDTANNDATNNDGKKEEEQEQENSSSDPKDEPSQEDELKDLGFAILNAQRDKDYSYLDSILGKGASMDKSANTFYFENVSYPHEMKFVQAKESDIEYRFIHEEDPKKVIVGFAVVDYETESSFTIDFVFANENGEWKMIDMDKNA